MHSQQPQLFDPKKPPKTFAKNANHTPTLDPLTQKQLMPTVSQVHKLIDPNAPRPTKKPFLAEFLLPSYWGIWLAFAIAFSLIYLPLRWQFKLGQALGKLIFHLAKRRQQDTLINLKLCFPEKSDEERWDMAQQVFINTGVGVFESLCAWFRPDVFTRQVTISGVQHVITAQQAGKAVLVLGAHYTMLDLGGRLASMFIPVDVVYRPQNNRLLEWFIYNARIRIFNEQIAHQDMRHLAKSIKAGHIVWYTPDQDFGLKQGVMAPFFGVPAATLTAQRRLATFNKKQGGDKANPTAVVVVHFYRETPIDMPSGKKPHYHIRFSPMLDNYPSEDEFADAVRVNRMLENFIRIDATQYMWFHRRFKTQPDGRGKYYR